MTRYVVGFMCVLALGVVSMVGCSETAGVCSGTVCLCTEEGILAAIATGGGPYTFECDGPQTIVTEGEIVIDNDVILDGEGNLTVDGDEDHRVFSVPEGVTAELRGLSVSRGVGAAGAKDIFPSGGIRNGGTLTLTNSTVSENSGGSGIANSGSGTLTLTNSTVSENSVGIANSGSGTLTLTNSTVSENSAGSGITNYGSGTLTLSNSTVSGNRSGVSGGGIDNRIGALRLTNSTVSGNSAAEVGGGIATDGTLTLSNSTVSGNTSYFGGGIYHGSGTLTLSNSTVSGNSASSAGGGIGAAGMLTVLSNSTVSGNSAREVGAGIYHDSGTLTLTNTLIHDDCGGSGPTASGGGNLESPGDTCGFDQPTDQVNVTAEALALGPLQGNGGPTQTHAIGEGSVAIDAIPQADCGVTTDQRGEPRTGGTNCDVGAFERQPDDQ